LSRRSWFSLLKLLPRRIWRIMRSNRVTFGDKLLFVVPVALYWALPDFMPFVPIDDAAFTGLAAVWYARAMERKYGL